MNAIDYTLEEFEWADNRADLTLEIGYGLDRDYVRPEVVDLRPRILSVNYYRRDGIDARVGQWEEEPPTPELESAFDDWWSANERFMERVLAQIEETIEPDHSLRAGGEPCR